MSRQPSVCPHDCPSVCALDVEVLDGQRIGRVYGSERNDYTAGVVCAKVSRYAERIHHPDRLTRAYERTGRKGRGLDAFRPMPLDEAIERIVEGFHTVIDAHGAEAIWPFYYAGTMGLVQRDGLMRLRHSLKTSQQHSTYCVALSDAGWRAGAGSKRGADARTIALSELVVIWGGNPVSTQVNLMHHVSKARRNNGARVIVVDPYRTITASKADQHLMLRPGTDGALACAVMHVLLTEGLADRDYLAEYTDFDADVEAHFAARPPAWAADITGLTVEEIVAFARAIGSTKKCFLRLGYGFSRSRNGAVNMHAASCIAAVAGSWRVPGGGALYGNAALYPIDKTLIEGHDLGPLATRTIDQSRIGEALCGNPADLAGGPPVKALFVQNTNPAVVAPDTRRVLEGLAREDLFTVVHEQFFTETARYADIIVPATMFLEHDDLYTASGHTRLQVARKLIDAPGDCISNHALLAAIAGRMDLAHPAYGMSEWELIDATLQASGLPGADALLASDGLDCASDVSERNFAAGFDTPDRRFRFRPDWAAEGPHSEGMPSLPDHWDVIDAPSEAAPLRLVASPARQFLNSSFTETPGSRRVEKEPFARLHPDDIVRYGLTDGGLVTLGNARGQITLKAMNFDGLQPGTVVVEGLWPNADFAGGLGVNALISSEPGKPNGGAVYHDTAVWVKPVGAA